MQKGINEKNTEKFIKYINYLDANIYTKKVRLIALIFSDNTTNLNMYIKPVIKRIIF